MAPVASSPSHSAPRVTAAFSVTSAPTSTNNLSEPAARAPTPSPGHKRWWRRLDRRTRELLRLRGKRHSAAPFPRHRWPNFPGKGNCCGIFICRGPANPLIRRARGAAPPPAATNLAAHFTAAVDARLDAEEDKLAAALLALAARRAAGPLEQQLFGPAWNSGADYHLGFWATDEVRADWELRSSRQDMAAAGGGQESGPRSPLVAAPPRHRRAPDRTPPPRSR